MREIIITEEFMDMRLDRFISKVTTLSKGEIQKLLRKKYIKVNGKKQEGSYRTEKLDKVQFFLSDEVFKQDNLHSKLNTNNLNIIYEDKNIILIDKPSGILSQADGSSKEDIVSNLISYLNSKSTGIVTRLDLNTSGIVLAGKNRRALMLLNEMSKNKLIDKRYLTLVRGDFDREGKVTHYGIKDNKENKLILGNKKVDGSFEVSAEFIIKKRYKYHTLLEVRLITGKTHQIRSQLDKMGFPVVGDRKYNKSKQCGNKDDFKINRQFLHCYKLTLKYSEKYKEIVTEDKTFYSDLPKDLKNVLKELGE
ncbi:RluA family pseudouridine synthase [Anaerofustis stercorihominis]|uniref:RNA pseudouridylate synthase n=2 Tax=Anaerofustis stercorihominis TaxID=214853 RepID=B1C9B9_9FIRM|nr:RluA family pseudouridine synthase [Anaerofustis stercorihominis]EDS72283.1 pseudouridine synthase, RluA family [Anaerofustis stercorihominis DSM 17244]MCQ4795119.1 RluA family pseudouridine synthase [Anaerofustis stercorihominis]